MDLTKSLLFGLSAGLATTVFLVLFYLCAIGWINVVMYLEKVLS